VHTLFETFAAPNVYLASAPVLPLQHTPQLQPRVSPVALRTAPVPQASLCLRVSSLP
jgi:hypothetical protein